jgi:2-amino-4-hydroxy-6-hydroxymethyldihydropteridine diphosphokinase
MHHVYLGLGSNIDARTNIPSAINHLRDRFAEVALSPMYKCPAEGFDGDDFINLAARVETGMAPLELANYLHELENRHNRNRSAPRWSSRTLDIDILLYGDLYLVSPVLEIPRNEILTAAHVLKPLADLAPDLLHPMEQVTIAKLWAQFPKKDTHLKPVTL